MATVVDLRERLAQRRLDVYREKIGKVAQSNRQAIGRLYTSGALFSQAGAKAGRDLLLAHQHLLKVVSLLNQLADSGEIPAPRSAGEISAVYEELDGLLDRTSALTLRTGQYLARLRQ
jgi:hypothetical protein